MAWQWTSRSWTVKRHALAWAVYEKTRKEAAYAPMTLSLGGGNVLLRSFARSYLGPGLPATIAETSVLEAIKVRDARLDQNRFSGPLPAFAGRPGLTPGRGGLYCSEDIRAAMAELFHYSNPNLSRALIGRPARLGLFTKRCFVSLRAVGELDVVNLNSESPSALPFFARLQADAAVASALSAAGYADLFQALYAPRDYAAARGLGLGLESNRGIDGIQVISARDYETDAGGQRVLRTGDNVMLFGLDQRIAADKVCIEGLHLVDAVPGSADLSVTHYKRQGGVFRKTGSNSFTP